jgi:hydrogenase maturation protease
VAEDVLVVGVGNALRGDDGAGVAVVRRLRERAGADELAVRELEGEGIGLLDAWAGARAVLLVDSIRSGAAPGTIHRVEATGRPLPAELRSSTSTHAIGVADAIELARALGRLPDRLVVYGIEGGRFDAGAELSPAVAAAIDGVIDAVLHEGRALAADVRRDHARGLRSGRARRPG